MGGIIVIIGLLLLLHTTELYETTTLLRYVPSLFILVGVYALATSRLQNLAGPLVLILLAGTVQLIVLDVIAFGDVLQWWPLLIVIAGLSMLFGHLSGTARDVTADRVDAFALLGGNEQRATGETFTQASLSAIFGGVTLDLRDTTVADPPARVNVTALFGGVDVIVPREWNVQIDMLPILGAAEDERPRRSPEEGSDRVDLIVTGFVAFGGVTVKD